MTAQQAGGDSSEDEEDEEKAELLRAEEAQPEWRSTTDPIRPSSRDRSEGSAGQLRQEVRSFLAVAPSI